MTTKEDAAKKALDAIRDYRDAAKKALDATQQHKANARTALNATQRKSAETQDFLDAVRVKDTETQRILETVRKKNNETQRILETVRKKNAAAQDSLDELKEQTEKLTTATQEALEELKSTEQKVHNALGDTTAAGLANAFTQAIEAEEKRSRKYWVWGAIAGVSVALTFLLYQQLTASSPLSLWAYISKAPIVAISLAVAWFCGSQYIKLENTLEDYRYKKVLAQSMANFMDQLSEVDEERRKYLLTLFQQMLQDPLRKKTRCPDSTIRLRLRYP